MDTDERNEGGRETPAQERERRWAEREQRERDHLPALRRRVGEEVNDAGDALEALGPELALLALTRAVDHGGWREHGGRRAIALRKCFALAEELTESVCTGRALYDEAPRRRLDELEHGWDERRGCVADALRALADRIEVGDDPGLLEAAGLVVEATR